MPDDILGLTTMPFFGDALAQTDVPPGPFTAGKAPTPPAKDMIITMEFQIPEEAATYKAALQGMLCKGTLDRLIIEPTVPYFMPVRCAYPRSCFSRTGFSGHWLRRYAKAFTVTNLTTGHA